MAGARKPKVACVVLAAGMSIRFDGLKQLAKVKGKTLIQNALDSANKSKADYAYLVLGHGASEIVAKIKPGRMQILLNKDFERGLSTSLKASISNIPEDCSGVLFMAGDQPFVSTRRLDTMIDLFKMDSRKIVALGSGGEPRNPVVIPRTFFPEILALSGDIGAREIVRRHLDKTKLIDVRDEKVFLDIDTRPDLKKTVRTKV